MPLQESDLHRMHKCEGNKHTVMQPLTSLSNPAGSEFYCSVCHVSEQMPLEVAKYYNQVQKRMMMENNKNDHSR